MENVKVKSSCKLCKEDIRVMAIAEGFSRASFLSPFRLEGLAESPSLLVCSLVYGNTDLNSEEDARIENAVYIAPFAQKNYYKSSVKRLKRISQKLRSAYGGEKSEYSIYSNSHLPEKKLAVASGLGFLGRNSLVITPESGSLFVISAMTLPFYLESDILETKNDNPFPLCVKCDENNPPCVKACPTKALKGDGTVTLSRCIQWYASGNGETVPQEVKENWGNRLYGCTSCQDACIYNKKPIPSISTEEGQLPAYIDTKKLLSMSDEEIKIFFKGTALGLSWLGAEKIRRNAEIVLNMKSDCPP